MDPQDECLDEDTASALAEGRLFAGELERTAEHLDGCTPCRRLLAALIAPEPRSPHGLRRGDRVSRYVILGLLGAGGMGLVYKAYDPQLDRRVALKVLPAVQRAEATEARLLREAQVLGRLSHRHLLRVHDVGRDDGLLFFAMELVEGTTLRTWSGERSRGWREILPLFLQAGRGLAAAHAAGVLHRDFKPDNVLCVRDGSVVVADFGLARLLAETPDADLQAGGLRASSVRTDPRGVPGTPAYLAPELYAGQPATERTDQFSFCVSLYEALYGQRPFAGQTVLELRAAVQHGTPRPPPAHAEVPRWLLQIVLRGLSREPAARFRSMDELLAALAAGSPVRRRLRLVVPAALVAALLGVGLHGLRQSALVRCLAAGRTTGLERTADPALRAYGAAWSVAWRQSCLSAHLWRTNTGAAAESQAACLELARAEAQARAALRLSLPDRDPGPDMPLRELRRCGRPASGVRGWPAPGPAGEALRTLLAKAQAQQALGEARLARASAEQALVLAERHHLGAAAAEALPQQLTLVGRDASRRAFAEQFAERGFRGYVRTPSEMADRRSLIVTTRCGSPTASTTSASGLSASGLRSSLSERDCKSSFTSFGSATPGAVSSARSIGPMSSACRRLYRPFP